MKKIKYIIGLMLLPFLISCDSMGDNYTYTFETKVVYTDSSIDTLTFSKDSFKGNPVGIYLTSGSASSLLSNGNSAGCLKVVCGMRQTTIACGVRRYEILKTTKIPLN